MNNIIINIIVTIIINTITITITTAIIIIIIIVIIIINIIIILTIICKEFPLLIWMELNNNLKINHIFKSPVALLCCSGQELGNLPGEQVVRPIHGSRRSTI